MHANAIGVGVRVRLSDAGEVGIVVHSWHSAEIGGQDNYVAFFGQEFPSGAPSKPPYVLRYASTSLESIEGGH